MMRISAIIMANKTLTSSFYVLLRLTNSSIYQRRMLSNTLSVCTFNILSPCYKRLSSEYDRESAYESLWKSRHLSIINLLQSLEINLICLQEFWFTNPLFVELYQSNLSSKYSFYSLRRTGLLDDGLVILVDSKYLKVLDKCEFKLNDVVGHRVGLLLHIEFNNKSLLLINIHLTFPHQRFERRVRLKQIKKFLDLIYEYQLTKNILNKSSIILCGDFNSSYHNDPVYQLIEKQFQSSYKFIHGYEPNVTHLTHRNEQLGVDFIFYKSNIFKPISSELIPKGSNHLIWNDHTEWKLSDHRPLLTTFTYNENQ